MGVKNDSLGDRMKRYEQSSRTTLTRRVPVVIRIDGKAFHTFTRGFKKPFAPILMDAMQKTMQYLYKNVQGCVFGYTQSDEITLVLTDYKTVKTGAWFGYGVQKMCSIAASMATTEFNRVFADALLEAYNESWDTYDFEFCDYIQKLLAKRGAAMFDARAFSIPVDEVCNCLIWRQQDATRNSIEAVGQANFSYKSIHGKNCDQIQEMLWSERGIHWNDFQTDCKRGSCCYKVKAERMMKDPRGDVDICVIRTEWVIDREPPIFTQDREYVERWLK